MFVVELDRFTLQSELLCTEGVHFWPYLKRKVKEIAWISKSQGLLPADTWSLSPTTNRRNKYYIVIVALV